MNKIFILSFIFFIQTKPSQRELININKSKLLAEVKEHDQALFKSILSNLIKQKWTSTENEPNGSFVILAPQKRLEAYIEHRISSKRPTSLAKTICNHYFHKVCIRNQVDLNGKCPNCRTKLTRSNFKYIRPIKVYRQICSICQQIIGFKQIKA